MSVCVNSAKFLLVDVFSSEPFGGNTLPVFVDARGLSGDEMLAMTRELRQFESIFLTPTDDPQVFGARIFDLFEELPFAGHPLIGAAAALHSRAPQEASRTWRFELRTRPVMVQSSFASGEFSAVLDQGPASFHGTVGEWAPIAEAFGLRASDVLRALPLEVVSTGLRYLIVPVTSEGLQRARIRSDVSGLMAAHGAQFGVLLDPAKLEVRHWNNDGVIEDVATGSAAGTIAAYLVKHAVLTRGSRVDLSQGRFAGRPSRITIWVDPDGAVEEGHVHVAGNAAMAGHGALVTTCPAPLAA